tara:strand:+ start:1894 stop:2247 length:354 start_codon:yes stop_codon:yes gene_type:complete
MPRAKPDEVIIHRIELGSWERDHLSAVFATQAAKNIAEPAIALISDVSAMSLILGLGAGWWGFNWVKGEYADTIEMIDDFRTQLQASPQYQEAAERGFQQGSPLPDFIDRWIFGKIV